MRYLIVLLLAGCVTRIPDIDYTIPPPADWPTLQEKVGYVQSFAELEKYCVEPVPRGAIACALKDFERSICWIYLTTRDQAVLDHERAHCRGYDHVGDKERSKRAWERFKSRKKQ